MTLRSDASTSSLHGTSGPARPSLQFAQPTGPSRDGTMELPDESATQGKGGEGQSSAVSAKSADPQKVSERVYDLMKQDLIISRMRKGAG